MFFFTQKFRIKLSIVFIKKQTRRISNSKSEVETKYSIN